MILQHPAAAGHQGCCDPAAVEWDDQLEAAWHQCDRAKAEANEYVMSLQAERRERYPHCGRIVRGFVDRTSPRRGLVGRFACRRTDCPWCRRRVVVKAITHGAGAILEGEVGKPVYVLRCRWSRWGAVSRAIRRAGGDAGHVRVRDRDGGALVLAERRFPGAEPVARWEAVRELTYAIGDMAVVRHAVRFLGRWRPIRERKRWEALPLKVRPEAVQALAAEFGAKLRRLPAVEAGIAWRFGPEVPEADVAEFYARIRRAAVSKFGNEGESTQPAETWTTRPPGVAGPRTLGGEVTTLATVCPPCSRNEPVPLTPRGSIPLPFPRENPSPLAAACAA